MKQLIYLTLLITVTLFSCQHNQKQSDKIKDDLIQKSKRIDPNKNDTTFVSLKENETFVNFVKPLNASAIIVINVENPAKYLLTLDKKQLKYIRISQIANKNNQTDGPFDEKVTYDFTEKGKYYVTINENLMASEGPEMGDALLRINKK